MKDKRSKLLECDGKTHTATEWAKITGLTRQVITGRIRMGWDIREALYKPVKQRNHYSCNAVDYKECFDCEFCECTRTRPLKGEYRIMSIAHREATRAEKSGEK